MRTKLILAGAAVVTVLAAGTAISWGASAPSPTAWSHNPRSMGAMHRGVASADFDRMIEVCERAMEKMHADMMGADMMGADMMRGGTMRGGTMRGGMMRGGMMGR